MITDVFDITGNFKFYRGNNIGIDKFEIDNSQTRRLWDLIIYPKDEKSNRRAYLQNYENPMIEDFCDNNMKFSYENSFFLQDILNSKLDKKNIIRLKDFFSYQMGMLQDNLNNKADANIILVADDYDGEKQEQILRNCRLTRQKTFLLWRSVAACIGAENELSKIGAKQGDRVAIIDASSSEISISILTLKYGSDNKKYLIPSRKSFLSNPEYYPLKATKMKSSVYHDSISQEFWRHTFNSEGKFIVPHNGTWVEKVFKSDQFAYKIGSSLLSNADYCIVLGAAEINFPYMFPSSRIIRENGKNFANLGAGIFSVRNANGLPTYFDQCEPLVFIVQDAINETIIAKTLIEGNDFCHGGSRIDGEINRDFSLEKENTYINFLLNVGEINHNTPLKELVHEFNYSTAAKQPLVLYPSMIPGQGIAKVEIEATPLLRERVILDFLNMDIAFIKDENGDTTSGIKTIEYLQNTLRRSFPIDIPDVESCDSLWDHKKIDYYMIYGQLKENDDKLFCKSKWPNAKEKGIERFMRINVFGTAPNKSYPTSVSLHYLNKLFHKIADDYAQTHDKKFVRLAAWTYQKDNPVFTNIINDTIYKLKNYLKNEKNDKPNAIDFTLYANMLSDEQQQDFIKYFNAYANKKVKNNDFTKLDNWLRALSGILMYNRDVLKDLNLKECYSCAINLCKIFGYYIKHEKDNRYIKVVINCLLFILKKRKYDKSFLRKHDNVALYTAIVKNCELLSAIIFYQDIHSLSYVLIDFMENKGTIEGIPIDEA